MSPLVLLEQVVVDLGAGPVLGPLDLSLEAGAFLGLIGPPGSGKTLLLKVIAGLMPPTSGRVQVLGEPLASARGEASEGGAHRRRLRALRRRIGMVFQNNALFDSRTIGENVSFPLRGRASSAVQLSEAEIAARVEASLEAVGLRGAAGLFPHELSGGMQKRAGIARATVFDPEVRLYDEPTAGLDPVTSARILQLIEAIHARGPGVSIIISNEIDSLLAVVPDVLMLLHGRAIYSGPRVMLDTAAAPELARRFVAGDIRARL